MYKIIETPDGNISFDELGGMYFYLKYSACTFHQKLAAKIAASMNSKTDKTDEIIRLEGEGGICTA